MANDLVCRGLELYRGFAYSLLHGLYHTLVFCSYGLEIQKGQGCCLVAQYELATSWHRMLSRGGFRKWINWETVMVYRIVA